MIKTYFTITFYESDIYVIKSMLSLFLSLIYSALRFWICVKGLGQKVLSAGIFNGCLRFFLPDEGHYCRMNEHPVESVLHPSTNKQETDIQEGLS